MNEAPPSSLQPPLLARPAPRRGRWWKWLLGVAAVLFCLGLIAVIALALSLNRIVRAVARTAIENNTGLPTQIEELKISFRQPGFQLRGLRLVNTAEFGGETFLHIPELTIRADRAALSDQKLRLHLIRLNLAELHVVANEKGRRNTEAIKAQADAMKAAKPPPKRRGGGPQFAGRTGSSFPSARFATATSPTRASLTPSASTGPTR